MIVDELATHVEAAARVGGWTGGDDDFGSRARLALSACGLLTSSDGPSVRLHGVRVFRSGGYTMAVPDLDPIPGAREHMIWRLGLGDVGAGPCARCEAPADHTCVNYGLGPRSLVLLCSVCASDWSTSRARFAPAAVVLGDVHPTMPGGLAFSRASGDRLRSLLGVDPRTFYEDVVAHNLKILPHRPSRLPLTSFLRLNYWEVQAAMPPATPVLALGRDAMLGAVGSAAPSHEVCGFPVYRAGGRLVYHAPHPSGRTRAWNNPELRARMRDLALVLDL